MKQLLPWLVLGALLGACGDGDDDMNNPGDDSSTPGDDASDHDASGLTENPLGTPAAGVDDAPLSSLVAIALMDSASTGATNIPDHVKALVEDYARDELAAGVEFPLAAATTDTLRMIDGLQGNVVVRWLDHLTLDEGAEAPRFGANTDFTGYFGEGWEADGTPLFGGHPGAAWMWTNHEYVSGAAPTLTSAPTDSHLVLARYLAAQGVLTNDPTSDTWSQADIDIYLRWYKREMGGSWFRIFQDPATREWWLDRAAAAMRYDGSERTLVKVVGRALSALATDASGTSLPTGVVPGILGDCSGGITPWGTVVSAEENVQDYYGDLESAWTGDQKLVLGAGFDPGADVSYPVAPSATSEMGRGSVAAEKHNRDFYGYLAEMDPGRPAGDYYGKSSAGVGHRKLGAAGRARWENASFALGSDWKLVPGQKVVAYAGDDRRSGRIYKIVSKSHYTAGMTKAQTRALLDDVDLYVGHFAGLAAATGYTLLATGQPPTEAAPGTGRWVKLSTTSTDIAPNAAALGAPTTTVGAALVDDDWNGLGGFPTQDDLLAALFTASNKLGVAELNRPEDIEWNPIGTPRLYVAFTNHNRKVASTQDGVLYDPATHGAMSPTRDDRFGSIFAIEEANSGNPGASTTFDYWMVWKGTEGTTVWDAGSPDNIMIDPDGGVWFGTDGNFGTNGHADAIYYLDLDPAHRAGQAGIVTATFGKAFRVAATPSDAEATGPAFNSDTSTIFIGVQHPGEGQVSTWPARNP